MTTTKSTIFNGTLTGIDTTTTNSVSTISAWATPYNGGICVRTENDFLDLERKLIEITQIKIKYTQKKPLPKVKRILKNGDYMTVLWEDGGKTIVKRAEDEAESDYAAFTAALGIKYYGSNSALKRLVASAEVQGKKKKKKQSTTNDFDKAGRALCDGLNAIGKALQGLREAEKE